MKLKAKIGRFAIALFACLFFDIAIGIAGPFVGPDSPAIISWPVSFLKVLIAYPLNLIDRTYPYYAIGPLWFHLTLMAVNNLFQATVFYIIWNEITKNRQRRSTTQKMN